MCLPVDLFSAHDFLCAAEPLWDCAVVGEDTALLGSPSAPALSLIVEQPCFCCSVEEEMYVVSFSPLSTISSLQKEMVEATMF